MRKGCLRKPKKHVGKWIYAILFAQKKKKASSHLYQQGKHFGVITNFFSDDCFLSLYCKDSVLFVMIFFLFFPCFFFFFSYRSSHQSRNVWAGMGVYEHEHYDCGV